jgi:hypothetical protein
MSYNWPETCYCLDTDLCLMDELLHSDFNCWHYWLFTKHLIIHPIKKIYALPYILLWVDFSLNKFKISLITLYIKINFLNKIMIKWQYQQLKSGGSNKLKLKLVPKGYTSEGPSPTQRRLLSEVEELIGTFSSRLCVGSALFCSDICFFFIRPLAPSGLNTTRHILCHANAEL